MQKKLLIFTGVKPNERILKIAAVLKNRGIPTVGIFQLKNHDEDYARYFDSFIEEPDVRSIIQYIEKSTARIAHVFSLAADDISLGLIQKKNLKKKIVLDFKDVFPGIHPNIVPLFVERAQRILLERADGLVLRDGQAWLSARICRFKLTKKKILFPDFCWPEWSFPVKFKEVEVRDRFKLVHIGMVQDELLRPNRSGAGQAFVFEALLLNGHEIHFFPGPANAGKPYPSLERLQQKYFDRFFIQDSIPDSRLNEVLKEYDFGLRLSQSYFFPTLPVYWHESLNRYGVGARLYTYLSAGLPILATPDDRAPSLAVSMGLGLQVTELEQLDLRGLVGRNLIKLNPAEIRREKTLRLAVNRHIDRLLRFYDSL